METIRNNSNVMENVQDLLSRFYKLDERSQNQFRDEIISDSGGRSKSIQGEHRSQYGFDRKSDFDKDSINSSPPNSRDREQWDKENQREGQYH